MHFSWSAKIGFGLLIAIWVAFVANMVGNYLVDVEPLEKSAYQVISEEDMAKAAVKEEAPVSGGALALLASADVDRGKKVFKKCKACHNANEGGKHKLGPNLWDVVGRAKGSSGGFSYSGAMANKAGDWSYADLDTFLTNPKSLIEGTKMNFKGISKVTDRAALIVYLRSLSAAPKPLP